MVGLVLRAKAIRDSSALSRLNSGVGFQPAISQVNLDSRLEAYPTYFANPKIKLRKNTRRKNNPKSEISNPKFNLFDRRASINGRTQ